MRILVIAMPNSIHTARWLQQFDGDDTKEFILFPSLPGRVHKEGLHKWKRLYGLLAHVHIWPRSVITYFPVGKVNTAIQVIGDRLFGRTWRVKYLIKTIRRLKPDIVHALEFQNAGYICLEAKRHMDTEFPVWIATNWGSDIYLFSRLKSHLPYISGILKEADFYSAECARDYTLAENIGMNAKPLPVIPNAGGMHLENLRAMRCERIPSQRKLVMIKAYQMVFGRALTILESLRLIANELKAQNARICFFSMTADIQLTIELFTDETGLEVEAIPLIKPLPHADIMALYAQARCYVGLSISDGISTSMLEAMALGAFPIQTCTSCANEWIEDGVSGFIAPVDDKIVLSNLILRAMKDDQLVDRAAEINWKTICDKADYESVRRIANSFYSIAAEHAKAASRI